MTMEQWTVKDLRQLKLHKETPFRVGQQPLDMGYTFFNLVRSVRGQGPVRLSSSALSGSAELTAEASLPKGSRRSPYHPRIPPTPLY